MALTTNTQSASQVRNHAIGRVVTDAGAAAVTAFSCGFVPRKVVFVNLTDRITQEYFEGMAANSALQTVAAGTRTLETSAGVTLTSDGFSVPAALIPASKVFNWEAIG